MTSREASDACKEAFIERGFWPNEVMWACWKDAWQASLANAIPKTCIVVTKPRFWSREESDAWHRAIPNVEAAFDAIAEAKGEA